VLSSFFLFVWFFFFFFFCTLISIVYYLFIYFVIFSEKEAQPENPIFGVPHKTSLENAAKMKITHPAVSLMPCIRKGISPPSSPSSLSICFYFSSFLCILFFNISLGIDTQGIFRESGNVSTIKSICDNYNFGISRSLILSLVASLLSSSLLFLSSSPYSPPLLSLSF
jgi:hypothetical protein